jgi:hypothetical protein
MACQISNQGFLSLVYSRNDSVSQEELKWVKNHYGQFPPEFLVKLVQSRAVDEFFAASQIITGEFFEDAPDRFARAVGSVANLYLEAEIDTKKFGKALSDMFEVENPPRPAGFDQEGWKMLQELYALIDAFVYSGENMPSVEDIYANIKRGVYKDQYVNYNEGINDEIKYRNNLAFNIGNNEVLQLTVSQQRELLDEFHQHWVKDIFDKTRIMEEGIEAFNNLDADIIYQAYEDAFIRFKDRLEFSRNKSARVLVKKMGSDFNVEGLNVSKLNIGYKDILASKIAPDRVKRFWALSEAFFGDDVDRVNKNIEQLARFHVEHLRQYHINLTAHEADSESYPDHDTAESDPEKDVKDFAFLKESFRFSPQIGIPNAIKLLISSLPDSVYSDGRALSKRGEHFGLANTVPFDTAFNAIAQTLAGSTGDYQKMIARLDDESVKDRFPYIARLVEYLGSTANNGDEFAEMLRTQFVTTFSKAMNTHLVATINPSSGDMVFVNGNSMRKQDMLFKEAKSYYNGELVTSADNQLQLSPAQNAAINRFKKVFNSEDSYPLTAEIQTLEQFYSDLLGIRIEINDKPTYKALLQHARKIMAYGLKKPGRMFNTDRNKKSPVLNRIKKVVEIAAHFDNRVIEPQHYDVENKTVYSITLHSYLTTVTNRMRDIVDTIPFRDDVERSEIIAQRKEAIYRAFPHLSGMYSRSSQFIDEIAKGNIPEVVVFNGMAGNDGSKSTLSNLDPASRYALYANAFLKGYHIFHRAADRGTQHGFAFPDTNPFLKNSRYAAVNRMLDHLKDEIASAMTFDGAVSYYTDALEQSPYRIFADILKNKPLKNRIEKLMERGGSIEQFFDKRQNIDAIRKDIEEYFELRATEEVERMLDLGVAIKKENGRYDLVGIGKDVAVGNTVSGSYKDLSERDINRLALGIVRASTVSFMDQTKVFVGDPAIYKTRDGQPVDFFKRMSLFDATKQTLRVDEDFHRFLDSRYPRQIHPKRKRTSKFNIAAVSDLVSDISQEAEGEFFREAIRSRVLQDMVASESLDPNNMTPDQIRAVEAQTDKYFNKYTKIDEADAFAIASIDEYRDILLRAGKWNKKKEELYQYEISVGKALAANKSVPVKPEGLEGVHFTVLKTQYVGPSSIADETQTPVFTTMKHMIMPLAPSMAVAENGEQRKLFELLRAMGRSHVDIVQLESGAKFGTPKRKNRIYDEEGNVRMKMSSYEGDYRYFGIQVEQQEKPKTLTTGATQGHKIILSDLYENGMPVDGELGKLANEYNELHRKRVTKAFKFFERQLGIKPMRHAGKEYFLIQDRNKFAETIKSMVYSGLVPDDNVLDSIEMLRQDDTYAEATVSRAKIENLMMAAINRSIIRQKRKGTMAAQVPATLFETGKRQMKAANHPIGNALKTYRSEDGQIKGMQVLVPKSFFPELKNYTFDEIKKQAPEILEAVSVRIPTQKLANLDRIEIAGFLPEHISNMIVVPPTVVAKADSDFDVDKLTVYTAAYRLKIPDVEVYTYVEDLGLEIPEGMYVEEMAEFIDDIEAGIPLTMYDRKHQEIYAAYEQMKELYATEAAAEIEYISYDKNPSSKRAINNRILEIEKELLTHERNIGANLTPVDDSLLKEIVEEVRTLRPKRKGQRTETMTSTVELKVQVQKAIDFLSGKRGVGQTAIHDTHHVLAQQAGLYLNERKSKIPFNTNTVIDEEGIERVSLAGITDQGGTRISDTLAALLTAYVDIAKDPYIYDLNALNEVANTMFFMLRMGIKPREVFFFITQQGIVDYIREVQKSRSIVVRSSGLSKSRNDIRKEMLDGNKRKIGTITEGMLRTQLSKPSAPVQRSLLKVFFQMEDYASEFQKVVTAANMDSKGAPKSMAAFAQQIQAAKDAMSSRLFGNVDKVFNGTFIGAFYEEAEKAFSAYSNVYLTMGGELGREFRKMVDRAAEAFYGADRERLRDRMNESFINHVIQTALSVQKGGVVAVHGIAHDDVYPEFTEKQSLAREILAVKRGDHPEIGEALVNNRFIQQLIPNIEGKNRHNIELLNARRTAYDKNDLIDSFREIMELSPTLGQRLVRFALIQSGARKTPFAFTDLIPIEIYNQYVLPQFRAYRAIANNPELRQAMMRRWYEDFWRQHPEFVPFKAKAQKTVSRLSKSAAIPYRKTQRIMENMKLHPLQLLDGMNLRIATEIEVSTLGDGVRMQQYTTPKAEVLSKKIQVAARKVSGKMDGLTQDEIDDQLNNCDA